MEAVQPRNEILRLGALHRLQVLDTPPEERFDRITRVASILFGVPIALVSLVDANRQWFKSCLGLEVRETSRGVSFCAHALDLEGPLVIPDTHADARFRDNPLVTGQPMVRFYAGAQLRTPDGLAMGTLCILDRVPRALSAAEQGLLEDLASWAEGELTRVGSHREAEVARSETMAILAATSEGIAVVSANGVITAADREFAGVFGAEPADLVGRDIEALEEMVNRAFPSPQAFHELIALEGSVGRRRAVLAQAWPQERDLEVLTAPVDASGERPAGRIFLLRDVTAETNIERLKSDFVATVAHELRTPLTAIMGYSDLVIAGASAGGAALVEDLSVIRSNAVRLNELVDDLLDVARDESGELRITKKPVQLTEVVRRVARTLAPAFSAKSQSLTLDLPDQLPLVEGDSGRLEQVLANLLSNAHKYTLPEGDVRVEAVADQRSVRVSVSDSGVGLSVDEQGRLYSKFFRARNPATRDVSGTGLGLVITRSLVQRHGGDLTVQSQPGQGSTFTVVLPVLAQPNGASVE